jgi:hypothetical protein
LKSVAEKPGCANGLHFASPFHSSYFLYSVHFHSLNLLNFISKSALVALSLHQPSTKKHSSFTFSHSSPSTPQAPPSRPRAVSASAPTSSKPTRSMDTARGARDEPRFLNFPHLPDNATRDGQPALNKYSTTLTKDHDFPGAQVWLETSRRLF